MNSYKNFGDLMGFFGINSNPIFASFYNTVFAKEENQNLDMRGATWGRLQDVFTYEMWERFDDVEVMATFTDLYSDPRPMGGSVKFKKYTGSVPRHKAIVTIDEVDVTEKKHQIYGMRSALDGNSNAESAVITDLEDFFYDKLSAIPKAHKNTLNYMLGQLKSQLDFKLDVKTGNGITGVVFPSHVPEENRKQVKFWTVGTDGKITYNATVNPVEWIQQCVYDIRNAPFNSYNRIALEMNAKSFKILLKHPAWAKAIAYAQNAAFYLTANNDSNATAFGMNWLLTASLEAKIEIFKQICDIDEVLLSTAVTGKETVVKLPEAAPSLKRKKMDCFDEGRMLFRPSGNIISIIPVAPNRVDSSAVISTDIFGGRGIIEYWYEPREKVATWRSEATCIPVFTAPSLIHNVTIAETATDDGGDDDDDGDEGGNT